MIPSMKLGATVRLRRADLDCLFEKRLPYSIKERIIKLAESKAGASTEEELNEDIADKYVSKKEACVILCSSPETGSSLSTGNNEASVGPCTNLYR